MSNVLKGDLYRYGKSKLLYGIAAFAGMIALFLTMLIRQDVRLGISIFGDLIAFKDISDIIRIGVVYPKGLGIVIAILISVLIGQEYQWKTWQHKWLANQSRTSIYLSKAMLSSIVSVMIFLLFQAVVLLSSGQIQTLLTVEYAVMITCSVFMYAALGAVICLLAMLIKSNTTSIIVCLGYVLFSETLVSLLKNASAFSEQAARLVDWLVQHSVYGMASLISGGMVTPDLIVPVFINSLVIIVLSSAVGVSFFRTYEI